MGEFVVIAHYLASSHVEVLYMGWWKLLISIHLCSFYWRKQTLSCQCVCDDGSVDKHLTADKRPRPLSCISELRLPLIFLCSSFKTRQIHPDAHPIFAKSSAKPPMLLESKIPARRPSESFFLLLFFTSPLSNQRFSPLPPRPAAFLKSTPFGAENRSGGAVQQSGAGRDHTKGDVTVWGRSVPLNGRGGKRLWFSSCEVKTSE